MQQNILLKKYYITIYPESNFYAKYISINLYFNIISVTKPVKIAQNNLLQNNYINIDVSLSIHH